MTQADGSDQLRADSQSPFPSSSMVEANHDFLFELDSFLQCVNEFDHGRKRFASAGDGGSSSGLFSPTSGRHGEHTLRNDDAPEPPPTGSNFWPLDASSFSTAELCQQQHDPMVYGPRDARNHYSAIGLPHKKAADKPTPHPQTESEISPTHLPEQPEKKREEHAAIPTATLPKKRNQNESRKRQREEIELLRASAQKLQHKLETLLGCDASDGSPTVYANGESRQPGKKELHTFLQETLTWKRAASSEKQQSKQAAMENLKLRAIVKENLAICKNFREVTTKSRFSKMPHGDLRLPRANPPREVHDESAIFASLRLGLDAQYQRLSAIWGECNFKDSNIETRQPNRLKHGDENNFYLEHVRSRAFPFSANAVSRAIWKRTKGGILTPNMGELKIRRVAENTVYATLTDTVVIPNAPEATIKMWITLKRFIQADQIVTVWQSRIDIAHSKRIQLAESGWNVVKGIQKADKKGESGLNTSPCISQTCIRATPDTTCAISRDEFADGQLTAEVVAQYHENMSTLNQTIENFLIDESLARGGGKSRGVFR